MNRIKEFSDFKKVSGHDISVGNYKNNYVSTIYSAYQIKLAKFIGHSKHIKAHIIIIVCMVKQTDHINVT